MNQIPRSFTESFIVKDLSYMAYKLNNIAEYEVDGNNQTIDGNNLCCHLLIIHNSNVLIKNLTFKNGNTEVVKSLSRSQISFSNPKGSIFEIIDGGAVLITGNSNLTFENCKFINNIALMCGGAISNQSTGSVVVRSCLFEGNQAGHTGSALDNLTIGSNLTVENCSFINNKSNVWNNYDSPHGQITIFPQTKTEISNSNFIEGSIPFDFKENQDLNLNNNKYRDYKAWSEVIKLSRKRSLCSLAKLVYKLYWLPFKTRFSVYYRVNK